MVELTTCDRCGRTVRMVRDGKGRPLALDPGPHPLGYIVLDEFGRAGSDPHCPGTPDRTVRYVKHWTTCPER
jgi:hypothetical protein